MAALAKHNPEKVHTYLKGGDENNKPKLEIFNEQEKPKVELYNQHET